jgi:hypothetical protein
MSKIGIEGIEISDITNNTVRRLGLAAMTYFDTA